MYMSLFEWLWSRWGNITTVTCRRRALSSEAEFKLFKQLLRPLTDYACPFWGSVARIHVAKLTVLKWRPTNALRHHANWRVNWSYVFRRPQHTQGYGTILFDARIPQFGNLEVICSEWGVKKKCNSVTESGWNLAVHLRLPVTRLLSLQNEMYLTLFG
jgi:hypothetical protein